MKVSIMQPYFFPYIGYFQLLCASDIFVFYDDVNYIKRGWVNRNRILSNGEIIYVTVPLKKQSQNKKINEVEIQTEVFQFWRDKFLKTIKQNYSKADCFSEVFPLVEEVLNRNYNLISDLSKSTVENISKYLGIKTEIRTSSEIYCNDSLKGNHRILDICVKEEATDYINLIGGRELYNKNQFLKSGINLHFLETQIFPYKQLSPNFFHSLSIIDIMMNISRDNLKEYLNSYIIQE